MKNFNKRILILITVILVGMFFLSFQIELVGADSGFDSSYDSVGDSDNDIGSIFYLIYLCLEYPPLGIAIITILVILYLSNCKRKKEILNKALSDNNLELLDVNIFPVERRIEIESFNLYKQIQYAWMNFDEGTIRKYTTDEMYNMYLMQLDTLKVKGQKNIIYDIRYIGSSIKERYEENGQETFIIFMQISCHDFIINTKNNNVVRGDISKIHNYSYELTFVKTSDNKKLDICPRCGAPVDGNNSGVCEYCKSTLISNNYTLILSKKKMLSQK